jgi:hypothetical protein
MAVSPDSLLKLGDGTFVPLMSRYGPFRLAAAVSFRCRSRPGLVPVFPDFNLLSKKLGDQDDGSLELFDSETGLAFRLKISTIDLDRLEGRDQMSVMYKENDIDFQTIGSESVRVIKSASLVEISAVYSGAVKNTFAVVRDADKVGKLIDDATRSFPSESAFAQMQRAILRLGAL